MPASLVARLRKRKGKHILLMGGGELGRAFLKADLVDELAIGIVPVLLGEGIPGFPSGFPQRNFSFSELPNLLQRQRWAHLQAREARIVPIRNVGSYSSRGG